MFGGFSLLYVVTYGYLAWTPALFIRTHEMDMATVGLLLGAANVVAGVSGNILGGWTCDRWIARGSSDAEIRLGLVSAAILLPLCIAVPNVPDADLALAIGRASCRERVCPYVWLYVGAGTLQKNKNRTKQETK